MCSWASARATDELRPNNPDPVKPGLLAEAEGMMDPGEAGGADYRRRAHTSPGGSAHSTPHAASRKHFLSQVNASGSLRASGHGKMENKNTELLHGHFHFKTNPDGSVDKTKAVCSHCKAELSYHRSTSSLKYHLNALHTVDARSPTPYTDAAGKLRQTTLDGAYGKTIDKHKKDRMTVAITKWIATNCRPLSIVEDVGLKNLLRIATNDCLFETPSRRTIARNIEEMYHTEKSAKVKALLCASSVALTGDYWTSLGNHNFLGVTAHYIDEQWQLRSHALCVMKTEERHYAETCAEHFIHVAEEWGIMEKVSTLSTDSARNMIAAARQLPFQHIPCVAHSLQRSVTVALQNGVFENVLAKCRKVVGHFKHSPASAAELGKNKLNSGKTQNRSLKM
ncbi:hypothetical protein WMY93_013377 [Mugilogobius chulae]|uniref:BED-type domain-containing protein n=1 Tax=Mugilogobius chulae TaxID=88201 RepID=A0AAW0P668_9GOBI